MSFRTFVNRIGVTFDAARTDTIFAEDMNDLGDAIDDLAVGPVWIDYSSTSTVVGWSSTTVKSIRYTVTGKIVHLKAFISGTSNSTSTTFTLPIAVKSGLPNFIKQNYGIDNGTAATKLYLINMATDASKLVVSNSPTVLAGAWTASGSKSIALEMFYEIA